MAQKPPHIQALQEEFLACRKLFTALGDETRQELLCALLAGPCQGSRGVELAEKIHLSRPAVSHHLQILKEAGIVRARRHSISSAVSNSLMIPFRQIGQSVMVSNFR